MRATEMGVLEVIRILESEGEQSVHADVSEPYQAQRRKQLFVLPPSVPHHQRGQRGGVSQVVHILSDSRTPEIARHEEIRKEQHQRDQPPRSVGG